MIAFFSGSFPPLKDGIGDYGLKLVNALSKHAENAENLDVYVYKINFSYTDKTNVKFFNLLRFNIIDLIYIAYKLSKYTKVIFQFPTGAFKRNFLFDFLPALYRFFSIILFTNSKGGIILHEYSFKSKKSRFRLLLSCCFIKNIIVVEPKYITDLCKIPFFKKKKYTYIPVPSNISIIDSTFEEIESFICKNNIANKSVGYFGVVREGKGLELIIETMKEFGDIHFYIAGRANSVYKLKLLDLINRYSLHNRVSFLGDLNEKELNVFVDSIPIFLQLYPEGLTARRGSFIFVAIKNKYLITTNPIDNRIRWNNLTEKILFTNFDKNSLYSAIKTLSYLYNDNCIKLPLKNSALESETCWENTSRKIIDSI
jgi:hypothetical protein